MPSDCLCIMQDSPDDWSYESATMGTVYRNSVLTICALHGTSCHSGLFMTRKPLQLRPCRIREYDSATNRSALYVHSKADPEYREWQETGKVGGRPLQRRAWVLAERILSPRSLYFGSQTISWECVHFDATEARPRGEPLWDSTFRSFGNPDQYRTKRNFYVQLLLTDSRDERRFITAWHEILDIYTTCILTYGKDKLPAIHGVISNIEQNSSFGYRNVAGIWTHDLPRYLLWWTSGHKPKPQEWRSPSWSWAAVDDHVYHYLNRTELHKFDVMVENLHVSVRGVKENGQLGDKDGCILKFSAPLKMMCWGDMAVRQNGCPIMWYMDSRNGEKAATFACVLFGRRTTDHEGESRERREDLGLMLIKDGDSDSQRWRRIGFFEQIVWKRVTRVEGENGLLFPADRVYVKKEFTVV